ncbi:hypothetical protein AVEN_12857-1 [Araneus ventricosus]|uniref:Integrase catalytic domain-containing protein n=1 Tax=Araneus ventricosus TaxID=182803 RepID=A0A4Y2EAZ9_ARAVE|nr:hypothetical protein AVEN_12857-1 [Araneus ventricosus]
MCLVSSASLFSVEAKVFAQSSLVSLCLITGIVVGTTLSLEYLDTPTAPLPVDRLRVASVFEITGVYFAGPLYLKRNQKSWIVIYTCAVFRAIHLELTTSITESFLQSFRRYVARRGRPSIVYSDNGTNLVGVNNLIKRINWERVAKYSTVNKIDWKFIPPSVPWWSDFGENLIGMVK